MRERDGETEGVRRRWREREGVTERGSERERNRERERLMYFQDFKLNFHKQTFCEISVST